MTGGPPRRDVTALREPDPTVDLGTFPAKTLRAGVRWYREHGAALGPWWYASDDGGRFNLDVPQGTVYLANTPEGAARERVGPAMAQRRFVPAGIVDGRVVSELLLPHDTKAAQTTAGRAIEWGLVTSELCSTNDYALTRSWARAFAAAGYGALWVMLRFSVNQVRGLALFGTAGEQSWAVDPHPRSLRSVLESMQLTVLDPPSAQKLTIIP